MAGTPAGLIVQLAGLVGDADWTEVHIPPSGLVKFGWLKMLKMSARNCIVTLSVMAKFFIPERSNWKYAGPRRELRPTVPIVAPGVPSYVGSTAKALML
jgi:hypothetical protein